MKKIAIVAVVLCILLSTFVGSVALAAGKAGAQRVSLYPVAGGSSNNVLTGEPSQGAVVINDPMGDVALIIQGNAYGLQSNHFYTVWVRNLDQHGGYTGPYIIKHAPLGYYLLDTFTTNAKGKGHFHLNIRAQDLPSGEYQIQVAINDPPSPGVIGPTILATVKYTIVTVGY